MSTLEKSSSDANRASMTCASDTPLYDVPGWATVRHPVLGSALSLLMHAIAIVCLWHAAALRTADKDTRLARVRDHAGAGYAVGAVARTRACYCGQSVRSDIEACVATAESMAPPSAFLRYRSVAGRHAAGARVSERSGRSHSWRCASVRPGRSARFCARNRTRGPQGLGNPSTTPGGRGREYRQSHSGKA